LKLTGEQKSSIEDEAANEKKNKTFFTVPGIYTRVKPEEKKRQKGDCAAIGVFQTGAGLAGPGVGSAKSDLSMILNSLRSNKVEAKMGCHDRSLVCKGGGKVSQGSHHRKGQK